jgi:nucleoside-diphosphate-sugar epimerase
MRERVFLAGATGAIGIRVARLLAAAGYEVFGTTRSSEKVSKLEAIGVTPLLVDAFDQRAVAAAFCETGPRVVMQQLTDLPDNYQTLDAVGLRRALVRNARMRKEGTRNLVTAAIEAHADRFIAQSIAWAYAAGPEPHSEDAALDLQAEGTRAITIGGVVELERLVLGSPPLIGTVLRYGQLYGPDTGADEPAGVAPVHVDAAAWAALLATQQASAGVFNVAESESYVSTQHARSELGWRPDFRLAAA